MAATWVSKIGCGILPAMFQTISMSWRAAWNTLQTFSSAISVEERREIDARRERIDDHRLVRARHLRDAEQRVIGGLAQEFGVDGDEGCRAMRAQTSASSAVVAISSIAGAKLSAISGTAGNRFSARARAASG